MQISPIAIHMQGKGFLGLVKRAASNNACQLEVEFTKPDHSTPVDTVHLKPQAKHPEEELPLYSNAEGCQVCGQVRATQIALNMCSSDNTSA